MLDRHAISTSSLLLPVVALVAGSVMAYWTKEWGTASILYQKWIYGASFLLVSCLFFYFVLYKNNLQTSTVTIFLLFFSLGYGTTSHEYRQFTSCAISLDTASIHEGRIEYIENFARMDRLRIHIKPTNLWDRPHYFNILLLERDHSFMPGMMIRIRENLQPIDRNETPFQFDPYTYWKYQHTSHQVFIRDPQKIEILNAPSPPFFYHLRHQLIKKADQRFPVSDEAALVKALLLGDKTGISEKYKSFFKNAGLLHILAVSGLHVGIVTMMIHLLLFPVRYIFTDAKFHWFMTIGLIWCYAAVTGLNIPVVRAAILATFFIISRIVGRKGQSWNLFFWAVILTLITDPFSLFTVSFQLSFGAVGSILLFLDPIRRKIAVYSGENSMTDLIAVSLSAQTGLLPLLIYHFNEFSTVGLLSSILIIPLLLPVILSASATLLLPAGLFITYFSQKTASFLIGLIHTISEFLGSWNYSHQVFTWHPVTIIFLILSIISLAFTFQPTRHRIYPALSLFMICLVTAAGSEIHHIYQQRQKMVLYIKGEVDSPMVDIYYKGVCYTNSILAQDHEITKSRKKHYIQIIRNPWNEHDWVSLFEHIKNQRHSSSDGSYIHIPVNGSLISLSDPGNTSSLISYHPTTIVKP